MHRNAATAKLSKLTNRANVNIGGGNNCELTMFT